MRRYVGAVFCLILAGCATAPKPNFSPAEPNLKVVTYNINWGCPQPAVVVDYLAESNADVICLQETHSQWEAILKYSLSARYPYSAFKGSAGAGGIAIMSKYPLRDAILIEPNEGWFPALLATVQTPLGMVQILNVHLRPRLSNTGSVSVSAYLDAPDIHLKEISGFLTRADRDKPLIITGDFNENDDDKAIRWLIENGFNDTLRTFDTYTKTWVWNTSAGISLKARLDHIIINKYLNCTGSAVAPVRASDHLPVFATIILQP